MNNNCIASDPRNRRDLIILMRIVAIFDQYSEIRIISFVDLKCCLFSGSWAAHGWHMPKSINFRMHYTLFLGNSVAKASA